MYIQLQETLLYIKRQKQTNAINCVIINYIYNVRSYLPVIYTDRTDW